jgi:hypothetical protein
MSERDGGRVAEQTAKQAYAEAVPQDSLKDMSAVDKLLAMEEIRLLPLRYGRCITQKDWVALREVFAPDFYYLDGPRRVHGPEGFIQVMRIRGPYDRVNTVLQIHGHEIEILSPGTARGIAAAAFTFYYPLGQPFQTTGEEVVAPGQQTHTSTYYYQTYAKVDGQWKIKTSDHIAFDLRRDFSPYTTIMPNAYVSPDGVRPYQR